MQKVGGRQGELFIDWNHATGLLKQHSGSKCHQDSSITVRMAKHVKQLNAIECAGAAKQAEEQKKKNREIILKLMRSIYVLAKNCIPHSTTYKELIDLQVRNGNELLEKHLSEWPSNAQYTSRFSASMLIEAIDIWIERKLMCSLQESPSFSILADECQDISIQGDLSICGRWLAFGNQKSTS